VSEVQIEESSGGGCNIIGQFVSSNDTRCISIHGLQNSLRESKEITLQNGRKLINEMGSQLRLNQHCLDTAFNFYKWAVQRGLTRGRKIRQVIAACLYIVCRTERTPHMLLDLCDIVHDDACYISSLGKLAMKFAYLLCINLPEIDPGLFIPRFAQKLDFGDKTHEVSETALRLVQRMNKDWMATGRRPSGLCGAALLVSARMYDFDRSLDDIVKVVKIGKTTLRKRMLEFEDTQSSNLTVDEFRTINLDELEAHDPPAFTRSRKFAIIKQIEEMTNIQEIEKEIIQLQENIETALNELNKPRGVLAKYAKLTKFEDEILGPNKDVTNIDTEIKEAEEFLSEDQINLIKSIVMNLKCPRHRLDRARKTKMRNGTI
jgi:transcription factor IIIB subunit 2